MSGKKYFVLMEGGNDTTQVFVSKQPRGAALKAATRGHTSIELRERGTNKVHVFKGWTEMVDKLVAEEGYRLCGFQRHSAGS